MKSTIKPLSLALITIFAVSSCSIHIEKRQHRKGYFININNGKSKTKLAKSEEKKTPKTEEKSDEIGSSKEIASSPKAAKAITKIDTDKTQLLAKNQDDKSLTAESSTNQKKDKVSDIKITKPSKNIESLSSFKDLKKNIKNSNKDELASDDDVWLIILVLLALIISPLAVYFERDIGSEFFLNLILYLLGVGLIFFVPFAGLLWLIAVIHALIIIFDV